MFFFVKLGEPNLEANLVCVLSLEFVTHVCNRVWSVSVALSVGQLISAAMGSHFF